MDIERLVEKWLRLTLAEQRYIEGIVDQWLAEAEAERVSRELPATD